MDWIIFYLVVGALWAGWVIWVQFQTGMVRRMDASLLANAVLHGLVWPPSMFIAWLVSRGDGSP